MVHFTILLATVFSCVQFVKSDIITRVQVNETLSKIAVNRATGDVYVGGINSLFRFNGNLEFLQSVSLTPNTSESVCRDSAGELCCTGCRQGKTNVLEVDPNSEHLFVCSSAVKGLCSLHHLDDIANRQWFNPRDNSSFIGRDSVVGFVESKRSSTPVPWSTTVIVGSSWKDGLGPMSAELSFRNINVDNDSPLMTFQSNVYIHVENFNKRLKIHDTLSPAQFITVLTFENFTLLVTIQNIGKTRVTKLIRVCNNRLNDATSHLPLTELELVCKLKNMKYAIATSASVGIFYDSFTESKNLLVTFGRRVDHRSVSPDPTLGSVLCAFELQSVILEMNFLADRCKTPKDCKGPKWVSVPPKCRTGKVKYYTRFNDSRTDKFGTIV